MEASVDLAEVDLQREDLAGQDPPAATAAGRQVLGPPLSADLAARAAAFASSLAALTTSDASTRLSGPAARRCARGIEAGPARPPAAVHRALLTTILAAEGTGFRSPKVFRKGG